MRLDQAARAYIGVPWQHHGRSRHGLDCVGLLFLASRDIGTLTAKSGVQADAMIAALAAAVGRELSAKSDG